MYLRSKPTCPFVNEVETFNSTLENQTIMNQQYQKKKNGNSYTTSFLKNLKNIERLAKTETLWKFWMLCAILLMFPLGTVLCYTALRIRYGQRIKKYKEAICRSLVALKKKPWRLSPSALKNKLSHVTLNRCEGRFVVYRTRDRKVMKSINYYRPDLPNFLHMKN